MQNSVNLQNWITNWITSYEMKISKKSYDTKCLLDKNGVFLIRLTVNNKEIRFIEWK